MTPKPPPSKPAEGAEEVTDLRTTRDPIAVQYGTVTSALELLGIFDHDDITNVLINPKRITVIRRRFDQDGNPVAAGEEFATTVITIAIRREGAQK